MFVCAYDAHSPEARAVAARSSLPSCTGHLPSRWTCHHSTASQVQPAHDDHHAHKPLRINQLMCSSDCISHASMQSQQSHTVCAFTSTTIPRLTLNQLRSPRLLVLSAESQFCHRNQNFGSHTAIMPHVHHIHTATDLTHA